MTFHLPKFLAGALVFSVIVVACYETDRGLSAPQVNADAVSGPVLTKRVAGVRGRASLVFREAVSKSSDVAVSLGDTLTIEAVVDAAGDQVTGAVLLLSMDDSVLELIPQDSSHNGLVPFEQGEFMQGVVFNNDTIADVIGDPLANALPLFQLRYFENVPARPFGDPQVATGSGVLARMKVRVVGQSNTSIRLDEVSPIGWEMGYFVLERPGLTHAFDRTTSIQVRPRKALERSVTPTPDGTTHLEITLLRIGQPVADAEVVAARPISGQPTAFSESSETDHNGVARFDVSATGTGYYLVRATSHDGLALGEWNSIPINAGNRLQLTISISP